MIKRKVKQQLQLSKHIELDQEQFERLVQGCLDEVTPEQQQRAAFHNNRQFVFDTLRSAAAADCQSFGVNNPVEEEKSREEIRDRSYPISE